MTCPVCQKPVEPVALALTQKIVSREATEFRCLGCVLFKGFDLK